VAITKLAAAFEQEISWPLNQIKNLKK
jgi:hypothetical protein